MQNLPKLPGLKVYYIKIMRIFAITTNVVLTKKPAWLDEFRRKYDKPFEYHVTLKQPCYIHEKELPKLKVTFTEFVFNWPKFEHGIKIFFNRIKIDTTVEGEMCIMIKAKKNLELIKLQKKLLTQLNSYTNYVKAESKAWEENFKPHITIARNLSSQILAKAKTDLLKDYRCEGIIKDISLKVVTPTNSEGMYQPKNQWVYSLTK